MYYVTFNKQKGIANVRAKKLNGFSLMEMMVVLLIVAIIAAASAPMVTKKLSRNTGTGDSPWVFTGLNNSIAYNMNGSDNSTVLIGTSTLPNNLDDAVRLYIDSGNNAAHIAFGNGAEEPLLLTADPALGRIGFSNDQIPTESIAFGVGQELTAPRGIIALGRAVNISGENGIGIGVSAEVTDTNGIAIGNGALSSGRLATAIGPICTPCQTIARGDESLAIGTGALANADNSIAIGAAHFLNNANQTEGTRAIASGQNSIAIGPSTRASGDMDMDNNVQGFATAIGSGALAFGKQGTALGNGSRAARKGATAIGTGAQANGMYSTAIGVSAVADADNQIVLGTANETVYIPGNLVIGGLSVFGSRITNGNQPAIYAKFGNSYTRAWIAHTDSDGGGLDTFPGKFNLPWITSYQEAENFLKSISLSDRRLKNVGDLYTAGLTELKKLDFFHYTFKEDKEKTPHVGVIAQDLEKVFPDAVTKGEDGYLRIRWEDMFYAVINAVKELDNKIAEIVQNITEINSTIEKQNQTISEQAKIIEEQNTRLEELEELNGKQTKMLETQSRDIDNLIKRIEKLEAK